MCLDIRYDRNFKNTYWNQTGPRTEAVAVCSVAAAFRRSSSPRGEQAPCWRIGRPRGAVPRRRAKGPPAGLMTKALFSCWELEFGATVTFCFYLVISV